MIRLLLLLAMCGSVAGMAACSTVEPRDSSGLPVLTGPLSVADAVSAALKFSPTVESRKALTDAARARLGQAKSGTRLQVSTTATATAGNMAMILAGPDSVQPQNLSLLPDRNRANLNFMAMYPLYTGGRLAGKVREARSLADAAGSEAAASELDAAMTVKTGYYGALLARLYVDAYSKGVDESTERVRIAQAAFEDGGIAKYDLLRNQTELAESQRRLNDASRDAATALIDLKAIMGISPDSGISLGDELVYKESAEDLVSLRATALARRPEVAAARARSMSAAAGVDAARGAYKPQVYAVGMQDVGNAGGTGFGQGYTVGVAAALPLFDGGQRASVVQEAEAMHRQARADERDAVLAATRDVDVAYTGMTAAAKNVDLAKAAIDQADEDYRVIRLRYEAGKSINVEVLDAIASLTRARTAYADALYQHAAARARLTRAIGER